MGTRPAVRLPSVRDRHLSTLTALPLFSWYSEPPAPGLSTINATCESVFQGTPAWRGPRQNKRCVVLAQGFYEWLDKGREKQPYFVKRKDGKMMAFGKSLHHEPTHDGLQVGLCSCLRKLTRPFPSGLLSWTVGSLRVSPILSWILYSCD